MSKLGDLIVRLRLHDEDYKKGLKKASRETTTFASTLSKIKGVGLAVWGAIGASVVGFAKQLINSSNAIGDAWNRTTAQMKAGWDVFVQSVASMNWNNFIGRIKEATKAAKELVNALDSEFEVSNSIKLQKAAMAQELAELEIIARDQTKSYEERAAAAQRYLDLVKPLYDQELKLAQKLEDAQLGKWLAGSGLKDSEQLRKDLRNFLIAYGKDDRLISTIGRMMELQKDYDLAASTMFRSGNFLNPPAVVTEYRALRDFVNDYAKNNGYGTDIYALAEVYEKMRGDADTKPLVDAMIAAGEAAGAFDRETKRMQSALNSSLAQMNTSTTEAVNTVAPIVRQDLSLPTIAPILGTAIDSTSLDTAVARHYQKLMEEGEAYLEWYQQMVDKTAMMNQMLQDSIVQATTAGMQAFTDMMFGIEGADASRILAALMQPFAQTCTQLGSILIAESEAIKAFQLGLTTLNPAAPLAAGLALIALGTALGSAIKALGNSGGSGASSTNGGYNSGSSVSSQNYDSTLTVNVVGTIKGNDIALSLDRTNKSNKR